MGLTYWQSLSCFVELSFVEYRCNMYLILSNLIKKSKVGENFGHINQAMKTKEVRTLPDISTHNPN